MKAAMTATYKNGDKADPTNYRPFSLTSTICKIMETIITNKIMAHMENNNLFSNKLFGFLPRKSVELQLIKVLYKWTEE